MFSEFTELIELKKSTKPLLSGDVFVTQPKRGVNYVGKVIQVDIKSRNLNFAGKNLVYIYNYSQDHKEMPDSLDPNKLLLPPTVVSETGWKNGYFETIGNIPVTPLEKSVDFGFFDDFEKRNVYYNLQGERLTHVPRYADFNGLSSYRSIGREMHKLLYGKKYY
ncbi:Imm26 family immunity protein [Paenibacillus yanchengensis]|uniref:Imm26 family immunity protein n=1 Tax=Paenibacillus yanchengensis TaxID=2035833 RepID=A0ABW4YHZ6_9BACL